MTSSNVPVPKSEQTDLREAIRREIAKGCYLVPGDHLPYASKAVTVACAVEGYMLSDEMVDVLVRASGWSVDKPQLLAEARAHFRKALGRALSTQEAQGDA